LGEAERGGSIRGKTDIEGSDREKWGEVKREVRVECLGGSEGMGYRGEGARWEIRGDSDWEEKEAR